jgi:hypothetical protein
MHSDASMTSHITEMEETPLLDGDHLLLTNGDFFVPFRLFGRFLELRFSGPIAEFELGGDV